MLYCPTSSALLWVQKGRLSEDEARFYAAEVVDALEYIHKLGLIHRDIKVVHKHRNRVDRYFNACYLA